MDTYINKAVKNTDISSTEDRAVFPFLHQTEVDW
jgi:hypothetical protein